MSEHIESDIEPGEPGWVDEVAFPALLRAARNVYARAIHAALAQADCEDVPKNGAYVIGALARTSAPLSQIIRELAVSKQAAGQLIDTLVLRGYIERSVDPDDRRRLTVSLTERGEAAAAAQRAAVDRIEAEVVARMGGPAMAQTRRTLAALANLADAP